MTRIYSETNLRGDVHIVSSGEPRTTRTIGKENSFMLVVDY